MRNHTVAFKIIVCLMLLFGGYSCNNEIKSDFDDSNRAVHVQTGERTSNNYVFFVYLGHDAKGCPGCILFNGRMIHVNCQGRGDACFLSPSVTLDQNGSDITATTTDTFGLTTEDFFAMPDRSLNYTDENNNRIFLNIPAQLVYRDTATKQFTFTGLFFTNVPEYSND